LYCAWTEFSNTKSVRFNRSTDGGNTFSQPVVLENGWGQGTNVQTGRDGNVYVCWANYGTGAIPANGIGFTKSVDGGASFSPYTVSIPNGKQNFFPWVAVDDSTGEVCIVYYSFDSPSGWSTNTYMAYSKNGNVWYNMRVSDVSHITAPINNTPSGSTVSWMHSSNLTYVSGQGTDNYTVKAANSTTSGMGWIKAVVSSSCGNDTIEKDVWAGNPGQPITDPSGYPTYQMTLGQIKTIRVVSAPGNPYQYVWNITGSITKLSGGGTQCTVEATTTGWGNFYVKSKNECGYSVNGGGSVNVR